MKSEVERAVAESMQFGGSSSFCLFADGIFGQTAGQDI